jgi:hypothetical protein
MTQSKTSGGSRRLGKVSGPVTGGRGWSFGQLPSEKLKAHNYVLKEYLIEGVADAYEPAPGSAVGADGIWNAVRVRPAAYKTRLIVVQPEDSKRFNGIVLLNWQNVTAGVDLGTPSGEEIFRQGYAWVGATVQEVAMTGRTMPGPGYSTPPALGLPAWDPTRYGSLSHPGDDYCFDIFAQIARAVRGNRADGPDPMQGLKPTKVIATGGSQSAAYLAAYINMAYASDPLFDGFFLLVHWGNAAWPGHSRTPITPEGDITGNYRIRDDQGVPIMVLNSETEAWSNFPVRQPDTATFCYWEAAGTIHGGFQPLDHMITIFKRDGFEGQLRLDNPNGNTIDWSYVEDAGLRALTAWINDGKLPPRFPRIEMIPGGPFDCIVRDEYGNARGGMRVPEMEAPIAVQLGVNTKPNMLLKLSGERRPFSVEQLRRLYPSRAAYLEKYDAAVASLQKAGGLLAEDAPRVRAFGRTLAESLPK